MKLLGLDVFVDMYEPARHRELDARLASLADGDLADLVADLRGQLVAVRADVDATDPATTAGRANRAHDGAIAMLGTIGERQRSIVRALIESKAASASTSTRSVVDTVKVTEITGPHRRHGQLVGRGHDRSA